jgi:hypothetical protein
MPSILLCILSIYHIAPIYFSFLLTYIQLIEMPNEISQDSRYLRKNVMFFFLVNASNYFEP